MLQLPNHADHGTCEVQFRAEAFNLFNHWNYMLTNITTDSNSVNFGAIVPHTTGTTGSVNPRSIQIGFKAIW